MKYLTAITVVFCYELPETEVDFDDRCVPVCPAAEPLVPAALEVSSIDMFTAATMSFCFIFL